MASVARGRTASRSCRLARIVAWVASLCTRYEGQSGNQEERQEQAEENTEWITDNSMNQFSKQLSITFVTFIMVTD